MQKLGINVSETHDFSKDIGSELDDNLLLTVIIETQTHRSIFCLLKVASFYSINTLSITYVMHK